MRPPVATGPFSPSASLPPALWGWLGALVVLAVWQLSVGFVFSGNGTLPTPASIVAQFGKDGLAFYAVAALDTLRAAAWGFVWGTSAAVLMSFLVVLAPRLERPILQLGIVSYCLPIVAIGPLLMIMFSGDTPKIILAALSVFFTVLVSTVMGLRHVDRTMTDLVHVLGGSPWQVLIKVRIHAALPYLFAALRIAGPAAVLGALVAEYMGGTETGLGLILINSQQAMEISRTWAIALTASLMAGMIYAATSQLARRATPWARETLTDIGSSLESRAQSESWQAQLLSGLASIVFVLIAWWAVLKIFQVPVFIGKGPVDVWLYLTDPLEGAASRALILAESWITIRDSAFGLLAGTTAAIVVAVLFAIVPALQQSFMGLAIALRSVPLVAMTPIIVLIFGRGMMSVVMIGAIVTFFPIMVNLTLALEATPNQSRELLKVFGASRWKTLWSVQIPNALPALFTSLRIVAPLAITGALIAAWLATGKGLGYAIVTAAGVSDYSGLWARVALITVVSVLLYSLIGVLERWVLSAFSGRESAA